MVPPTHNRDPRASELVPLYAPHIAGRTILVTGVSPGGLGDSFVKQVAVAEPAMFILAGRSPERFRELVADLATAHPEIKVKSLALDLASFANVRAAAETVKSWADVPHIDVLVNNAGIMAVPYKLTEDGFESQFQTNHLGHFLFTNLIMSKILASASPRIVNVSSTGHRLHHIRWTDYNFNKGEHYNRWMAYGQSKTANSLFSIALAERLGSAAGGLTALSLCPGYVVTNLAAHGADDFSGFLEDLRKAHVLAGSKWMWGMQNIEPKDFDHGVSTHVFAAFAPELKEKNGEFLTNCRVADPWEEEVFPWAKSKIDAEMLWALSEKLVGQEFRY
ncbi:short chain dehydrogenase [Colletotrichum graminicola]|uniref:Short chain dehydrogenase n=1 Tax=Colletotrichum graminicola (strain M1.001 / M2 / FGSC 10212) TaxID=645133 RepID=E3QSK2_COLGM|nr:short chain dehydrogenase [Colletotrichum graminicola M1.001]EFQ33840.1 short chain dehydrogenase [Colletotrichum graminicola M1.001]WDK19442.1 short chain dehydrogenase [Colletotrichum graminicola]